MPIRVACPTCRAVLKAAIADAGEIITCPKCNGLLQLPEVEPDDPPPRPTQRMRRPVREPSTAALGFLAGGIVLILVLGAGIWLALRKPKADVVNDDKTVNGKTEPDTKGGTAKPVIPGVPIPQTPVKEPDWAAAAKKDGWVIKYADGFTVAMPWEMICSDDHIKDPDVPKDLKPHGIVHHRACKSWKGANDPEYTVAEYRRLAAPFPTTTNELLAEYKKLHPTYFAGGGQLGYEITAISTVTHAGRPAAMIYSRARDNSQFFVLRLIPDGTRLFALCMSQPRKPPTDAENWKYFSRFTIQPVTR